MKKISPQKFNQLCEEHDWFFAMSDDHKVWDLGRRNRKLLRFLCEGDPELEHIFAKWWMYKFYNGPKPNLEDLNAND